MQKYLIIERKFNAYHKSVDNPDLIHSHTFVVMIYSMFADNAQEKLLMAEATEFIKQFEGEYLDGMPYFEGNHPGIEEIGERFYDSIGDIFKRHGCELYQLGVTDNSLNTYFVGDRILLPNLNDNISIKNYSLLMKLSEGNK